MSFLLLQFPFEIYEAFNVLTIGSKPRMWSLYTVNSMMRVEQMGMRNICGIHRAVLLSLTAFLSFQMKQAFVFNYTIVLMPAPWKIKLTFQEHLIRPA